MGYLPVAIVLGYAVLTLVLSICKVRIYWILGISLIASQMLCVYDIIFREPAQIAWLCNVAVFMNIFLLFKFNQKVFDLYFFFTWIGCFFICLMPKNPYSLMIKDLPVIWVAYWIKHIAPLVMSIYFIRVEGRRVSRWSCYTAVAGFLAYCGVMYFYNKYLNQNILYLKEPAPFMEVLGKYYFIIIVPIGYFWVANTYVVTYLLGGVKEKFSEERNEEQVTEVESQSVEGS